MMTHETPRLRPATLLVHGGTERSPHGETAEALYLTSGFVYDDAEQAEATFAGKLTHYQYSRFGNPTVTMLEQRLAAIEGAAGDKDEALRRWSMVHGLAHLLLDGAIRLDEDADADALIDRLIR